MDCEQRACLLVEAYRDATKPPTREIAVLDYWGLMMEEYRLRRPRPDYYYEPKGNGFLTMVRRKRVYLHMPPYAALP